MKPIASLHAVSNCKDLQFCCVNKPVANGRVGYESLTHRRLLYR